MGVHLREATLNVPKGGTNSGVRFQVALGRRYIREVNTIASIVMFVLTDATSTYYHKAWSKQKKNWN